ncbi:probable glutamate receptor [Macrobrachium rosenbergii]|uniref:probable glutamate receptor n=1 Tax=Macrobrachium rosenbergii TaxID=79674 RepID=UPI0034D5E64F
MFAYTVIVFQLLRFTRIRSSSSMGGDLTRKGKKIMTLKPVLTIAAGEWVPYTKFNEDVPEGFTIEGPMKELLNIFTKLLNFDYKLVRTADNLWGGPLPNGSWTGMLGILKRQEAELSIAPFFITPQREEVCDFTIPVYIDNQAILMIRPTLQSDVSGFLKPFTMEVWLLIVASLISMVLVMNFIVNLEHKIHGDDNGFFFSKISLWILKALTQESSEWLPTKDAGRFLVFIWLMASFVFMSCYSGILTALLTVPKVDIPINSLSDLARQTKLPWRLEAGSMMYSFFEESTEELGKKVFNEKIGTFQDCWEDRERIAAGEFAAICDTTTMMKSMSWDFSKTGKCHLYRSREKVYTNGILSVAFRTKSSYLPKANKIILTLKEAGIMDKWLRDQMANSSQCLRPPTADRTGGIQPLDFESFTGSFLLLLGGK